jgi:hypothetical protein
MKYNTIQYLKSDFIIDVFLDWFQYLKYLIINIKSLAYFVFNEIRINKVLTI